MSSKNRVYIEEEGEPAGEYTLDDAKDSSVSGAPRTKSSIIRQRHVLKNDQSVLALPSYETGSGAVHSVTSATDTNATKAILQVHTAHNDRTAVARTSKVKDVQADSVAVPSSDLSRPNYLHLSSGHVSSGAAHSGGGFSQGAMLEVSRAEFQRTRKV